MTDTHQITVLGAAESGKTTYAGRLWLAFRTRNARIRSSGLPETLKPFKDASEPLLQNTYPPRTNMERRAALRAPLHWRSTQQDVPFTLAFEDYSGEELEQIFKRREIGWTQRWTEQAAHSTGVLLLVRSTGNRRPTSKRLCEPLSFNADQAAFDAIHDRPDVETRTSFTSDAPEDIFGSAFRPSDEEQVESNVYPGEPVHPPTEVALIEVLQFFRYERGLWMGENPNPDMFRVAVVISCWDAVDNDWKHRGPEHYLERHFPLLHDFLLTNFDPNGVAVFGLSSTGGDLRNEAFYREYKKAEPTDMGGVVFHVPRGALPQNSPDITLPIGWLIEGDAVFSPA